MVATRKRKAPLPKIDPQMSKKATKTIKKQKATPKAASSSRGENSTNSRRTAPTEIRKSTRRSKQFVPFDNSNVKQKEKANKAKAVVKANRRRAASVHRAQATKRSLQKAPKATAVVKDKNEKLQKREFIDNLKVNPFLFGSAGKVRRKVISPNESTRLAIRFVVQKDAKGLQQLVSDRKKFPSDGFDYGYAFEDRFAPETLAALSEDQKILDAVLQCQKQLSEETQTERASRPVVGETLLDKMSTGESNFYMLGHATRAIEMTRGGREGNNALLNYDSRRKARDVNWEARHLVEKNVSFATIEHLISSKDSMFSPYNFTSKIVHAVRMGHRKLAGKLVETYDSYSFNQLQIQTLLYDKQPLKKFIPVCTTKKAMDNAKITPFHTAAINPNVTYLKNITEVDSNCNVPDADNWFTIHYAAVCEGTAPLEYLLKKDVPLLMANKKKETPIHTAAAAGRVHNLQVMLNVLRKKTTDKDGDEEEDGPPPPKKSKSKVAVKDIVTTQLNAKNRSGHSPLRLAVIHNHASTVKFLLEQPEVDVESQSGAASGKVTPLMIACRNGNLEIANLLIEKGRSFVDKQDKLARTALTHAAMNGQTHVVAMLLRRGSDIAASTDSSGNSAVHYACAYGWLEILEMLAKADSEALTSTNAWHLTPLSVAYLKGHFDIVDFLLNGEFKEKINVNGKDNNGSTLIAAVVDSYREISDSAIKEQIEYLTERGADSSIVDVHLRTPLHNFARARTVLRTHSSSDERILSIDEYLNVVDALIDSGADIFAKDNDGEVALQKALTAGNIVLVNHLFNKDTVASTNLLLDDKVDLSSSNNVLHLLAELPSKVFQGCTVNVGPDAVFYDVIPFFEKLTRSADRASLVSFLNAPNREGLTPLLLISKTIVSFYSSANLSGDDEMRAEKKANAELVLRTMCELAGRFIDVHPEAMLNKCEPKEDPARDNNQGDFNRGRAYGGNRRKNKSPKPHTEGSTCMENALCMFVPEDAPVIVEFRLNDKISELRNPLLELILEKAAEHQLLKEILSAKDDQGLTPLLCSIAKNRDVESRYILHVAEQHGLLSKILRDKYAKDIKENQETATKAHRYECSALMLAAKQQMNDLLDGFSPSDEIAKEEDSYGNTVMHAFAEQTNGESLRQMKRFSEGGVLMKANHDGRHPLHLAVDFEKAEDTDVDTSLIDYILSRYPQSARLQDCHGRTALHYAFVAKLPKEKKAFDSSQEGTKRDPIAVVSVLLKFIDKKSINIADNFGNTALHYAAFHGSNICVVTMLGNGALSEAVNLQGNAPLSLAVLKEHEYVALTLIQAKSDVCRQVFGDEASQSDKEQLQNLWRWIPNRVVPDERLQKSIASLVVKNGWQGIIYIILDLLSKSPSTLLDLITAAVEHQKYNLLNMLLRLLERQKAPKELIVASDVIYHFFDNLQNYSSALSDQARSVLRQLLAAGFTMERKSLITLACHGAVEILEELVKEDSVNKMFDDKTVANVLAGLIRSWPIVGHSRKDKLKEWIHKCTRIVGVDCELEFPKPAFEGMEEFKETRPVEQKQKTTPLIWAIQHGNSTLIRHLLVELKADVNKADSEGRTPLMVAILWNSEKAVSVLFDPVGSSKPEVMKPKKAKNDAPMNSLFTSMLVNGRESASESEDGGSEHDEPDALDILEMGVQYEEEEQREAKRKAMEKNCDHFRLTNKSLDLQKEDKSNRTFIDYFVEPFGWENVELLEKVCKAAPTLKKCLESPMHRALELGQWMMACAMARIAKLPNPQWKPVVSPEALPPECSFDILADSKTFLDTQKISRTAEKKKITPKPNENSGYAESGDLVKCEETGALFRVLLNRSDVQHGTYGYHNFYRIELICRRGSSLYILFTNWGRIGDSVGQFQRTPFSTLEEAKKEFASVFRQKTGNEWAKIVNFEEKKGKYRLVEIEDDGDVDLAEIEMKVDVSKERAEKDAIYRMLADISDVERLRQRTRALKYDYDRTMRVPFGRINREKIEKASEILDELRLLAEDAQKARTEIGERNLDRVLRILKQQAELSNEFYKNMPLEGFTHCRLPVIDDAETIKRFEKCLEQLFEFDTAGTLITAAITAQSRGKDPIDYLAEALECRIDQLDPESIEAQQILQFVQNSSHARVEGIFSIASKEPTEAFAESTLSNRKYLWHGTKPENMLSILKHGLKATPSSAVQTGQMYGEGIYFADLFAKSESYCSRSASGLKYALLSEVALGEVDASFGAYWHRGQLKQKDSKRINTVQVYGSQRPNSAFNLTLPNGVTMPLGKTIESSTITIDGEEKYTHGEYSEYVVKDRRNTVVRYLVVFA